MRNRRGSHSIGAVALMGFIFAFGAIVAAASAEGRPGPPRAITVCIIADSGLRKNEMWKVDMFRAVRDISRTLEEASGIRLCVKIYDYWTRDTLAGGGGIGWPSKTLEAALSAFNDHIRKTGRRGCDIVIGLVPEGPEGSVSPGIADYLTGTVMVKDLESKRGIRFVLLHEICHIFGAVDLKINGSVMSLRNASFRIDGFTKAIMLINRQRSFKPGEFPLSEDRIFEAIDVYQARQVLGLGEAELAIFLSKLIPMRSDRKILNFAYRR